MHSILSYVTITIYWWKSLPCNEYKDNEIVNIGDKRPRGYIGYNNFNKK